MRPHARRRPRGRPGSPVCARGAGGWPRWLPGWRSAALLVLAALRVLAALLVLAATLSACGGKDVLEYHYTFQQRVQYTLHSNAGYIVGSDRVTFLRGDCGTPCTTVTNIHQTFSATASGGLVAVDFTDEFPENANIFVSIYVDKNASGLIDPGDVVWNNSGNPANYTGYGGTGLLIYLTLMQDGLFERSTPSPIVFTGPQQPW